MLAKAFEIDVSRCQHCKGEMSIVAAIIKPSEVARHLKHLGIEYEAPDRAPPRHQGEPLEFDSDLNPYETTATKDN